MHEAKQDIVSWRPVERNELNASTNYSAIRSIPRHLCGGAS